MLTHDISGRDPWSLLLSCSSGELGDRADGISYMPASAWTARTEAGNVDILKRRGRGRPRRSAEPIQVVAVRLTAEALDALGRGGEEPDESF